MRDVGKGEKKGKQVPLNSSNKKSSTLKSAIVKEKLKHGFRRYLFTRISQRIGTKAVIKNKNRMC